MKLVLHPLFIVAIAFALWAGYGLFVFAAVVAVLLHEFSHAWVAGHYGIRAKKLTLLPFGAQVNIDCAFLPRDKRVMILLAGAGGNIVAALFAGSFLWMWPQLFTFLQLFIVANVMQAVLNLLPVYPLDGGKILYLFCRKRTMQILKIFSNVTFGVIFFIGCFAVFNPALIILSVCMLFTINTTESPRCEYTTLLCKIARAKSGSVREVAVRSDMTVFAVYKLLARKNFTKFIITDLDNKTFYENDLEKILGDWSVNTRLLDIYNLGEKTK